MKLKNPVFNSKSIEKQNSRSTAMFLKSPQNYTKVDFEGFLGASLDLEKKFCEMQALTIKLRKLYLLYSYKCDPNLNSFSWKKL